MNTLIVVDVVLEIANGVLLRLDSKLQFLSFLVIILEAQKTE